MDNAVLKNLDECIMTESQSKTLMNGFCPKCHSTHHENIYEDNDMLAIRCKSCGNIYVVPPNNKGAVIL